MAKRQEKAERAPQRTIALYVSLIAVSALFFLFLSIRSLTSQWRVLLHPGDSDLQSAGQTLASEMEDQTTERAESYFADSEVAQIQALAESLPDPQAARRIRTLLDKVSKRHPVGRYPFVVRNGSVEFPLLKAIAPQSLQSLTDRGGAAGKKFAGLFQSAQRQHVGKRCPAAALKGYLLAYDLPVSQPLKALALLRTADCYRDQKQFPQAVRSYGELGERYGDEYDVFGIPYAVSAAFAMETLGPAQPDMQDQYARLYGDLIRGRWEVSAAALEKLQNEFRRKLGSDLPDSPTEFLNHLQSAQTLQAALRRKIDPKLLYRISGESGHQPPKVGDILAFAYADRGNSYQSYYQLMSGSGKKQVLLGFTVDMEWLQREILPELGAAGAFVITYKSVAGDSTAHANFVHLFPFWQLSVTPAFVRSSVARADLFVTAGSLLLACLGSLGILLLMRNVRQQREYARMRIDFVNGVSHELKTPITLIRLYAETLLGNAEVQSQSGEHCQIILNEAERLTHLVEHILDFSRGERGLRQFDFKAGDLAPVVEQTLQGCRDYLSTRKFIIGGEIRKDLPPVRFDAEAIPSLVLNLVDNAVKYSGDSKLLRVQAFVENDWVVLEVEDYGIGIAPSERDKIFEPYYRINTGVARGGCGLGLSLVKNIMEAHGGRVEVLSEVGKGTKFRLLFPVAEEANEVSIDRTNTGQAEARYCTNAG